MDGVRKVARDRNKDCYGTPQAHLLFDYADEDLRTLERSRELIRGIYRKIGATDVEEIEVSWSSRLGEPSGAVRVQGLAQG